MITYPISSNLFKKKFSAVLSVLQFSIFQKQPLEVLEKVFLEISQNSQENTCGKVSFLVKLQAKVTASDLSHILS